MTKSIAVLAALALAGSVLPASADLITVDFTTTSSPSCTSAPCSWGVSPSSPVPGDFVVDTTKTGLAAIVNVDWMVSSTKTFTTSGLLSDSFVTFSNDTVTAFLLDWGPTTGGFSHNIVGVNTNSSGLNQFILWDEAHTLIQCTLGSAGCASITGQSVTVTPLPAALPLFATGLGGLGLLGWRRKRRAQAVA
jgi:hypothetical protein